MCIQVFFFLGRSLHASLPDLGMLTLSRALVQALASPLSGILCTTLDRTVIVSLGCILWGTMTSAIGLCTNLTQAMIACALNGLGLALVVPTLSSLVADSTSAVVRGKAFGAMGLTASLGGMAGALFATNVGATAGFAGVEGWRWAFHAVAAVAFFTAWLVYKYAIDPGFISPDTSGYSNSADNNEQLSELEKLSLLSKTTTLPTTTATAIATDINLKDSSTNDYYQAPTTSTNSSTNVWHSIRSILRIRSFQVIVLQGIVGSIPWQAMAMMTLWLQLLQFSNFQSSVLTAIFTLGCALGSLLGGALGDAIARKMPAQGRIYVCQISVFLGMPLSWLLFKGLAVPSNTATFLGAINANNITDSRIAATSTTTETLNLATGGRTEDLGNFSNFGIEEEVGLLSSIPQESSTATTVFLVYAVILLITGLSISWCGCNNSALFAELVPKEQRTHVYAFDRSFEGALGACGAPLVGIAAEKLFGFQGSMSEAASSNKERETAAKALSSALLLCLVAPWALCLFSYVLLHWTYPKDRGIALKMMRKSGSEGGSLLKLVEDGHQHGGGGCNGGGGVGVAFVRKRPPSA
jgi:MFS family permease